MTTTYVLKWYHGTSPRFSWFIRGIGPDFSFYGEVSRLAPPPRIQLNVTGHLDPTDYTSLVQLAERIKRSGSQETSDRPWEGLLAEGPISDPRVICAYR